MLILMSDFVDARHFDSLQVIEEFLVYIEPGSLIEIDVVSVELVIRDEMGHECAQRLWLRLLHDVLVRKHTRLRLSGGSCGRVSLLDLFDLVDYSTCVSRLWPIEVNLDLLKFVLMHLC